MAETPNNGGLSCFFVDCENVDFNSSCTYTCYPSIDPFPFFPPPPPPPPPPSSQSHVAPFLIAIVCILGISFLLLTTCTIILRYRFTRRSDGATPSNSDNSGVNDDDHTFVDHPIWHITTVGLQQSVIDSITAFKYRKIDGFFVEGSDSSCSVCLTEFEDGDDLRLLPKCSHAFHVSCIDTWLRSHKNCPLCRAPIVNEILGGNSVVGNLNSSFGEESQRVNSDDNNGGEGSSHHHQFDLGRLPMLEGTKIAEILKRNRELRIFSDLGENHRFQGVEDGGLDSVRRSISLNAIAASAKFGAMMSNEGCSRDESINEGCSDAGNSKGVLQDRKTNLEKGDNKRGSSMSGLMIKSSSIGRSLQKGPVSMKRSLSSSSRFFSFRRSKSQASILPL
ncbi:RING-H2 finger protein ATL54 [Bienertia sinuspersici]